MAAKYKTVPVLLKEGKSIKVYASPRVGVALRELTADMNLYQGVRFAQILDAVYEQGKKDGALNAFKELDRSMAAAKKAIPHRKPGRPRKK